MAKRQSPWNRKQQSAGESKAESGGREGERVVHIQLGRRVSRSRLYRRTEDLEHSFRVEDAPHRGIADCGDSRRRGLQHSARWKQQRSKRSGSDYSRTRFEKSEGGMWRHGAIDHCSGSAIDGVSVAVG